MLKGRPLNITSDNSIFKFYEKITKKNKKSLFIKDLNNLNNNNNIIMGRDTNKLNHKIKEVKVKNAFHLIKNEFNKLIKATLSNFNFSESIIQNNILNNDSTKLINSKIKNIYLRLLEHKIKNNNNNLNINQNILREKFNINFKTIFNKLERIATLSKIKNILWKFYHGILTPVNQIEKSCKICNKEDSQVHALLECEGYNQLKQLITIWFYEKTNISLNLDNKLIINLDCSGKFKSIHLSIITILIWLNWKTRNHKYFKNVMIHPKHLFHEFIAILENCKLLIKDAPKYRKSRRDVLDKWGKIL